MATVSLKLLVLKTGQVDRLRTVVQDPGGRIMEIYDRGGTLT
jgi:hypothetical protein